MTKMIQVTLSVEVPNSAEDKDIQDWVDVEYRGVNSMARDNPCAQSATVVAGRWEEE